VPTPEMLDYILYAITGYGLLRLWTWWVNQKRFMAKNLKDPKDFIPGPDYKFPYQHILAYSDYVAYRRDAIERYNKWGLYIQWVLHQHAYLLIKSEYIKDLVTKPEETFTRNFFFAVLNNVFGVGLLGASGEVWKKQHRIISKAFTPANIPHFFPLFYQTSTKRFGAVFQAADEKQSVDMNLIFNEIAAESVLKGVFGCQGDQAEILTAAIQEYLHMQDPLLQIPGILNFRFIPKVKRYWEVFDLLKNTADRLCQERREILRKKKEAGITTSNDPITFLDLLLEATDDETGATLSDIELEDNCRTFLIAGSETTATTVSWTVYHLTQHPEIMKKVQEEVDFVVPDDITTFNVQHLAKLQYLPLVINEALRYNPPVGIMTVRCANEDVQIGEWMIPKGTYLTFSNTVVHFSPDHYDNPEEFRPERWEDGADKKKPFSFVPFGAGRRTCVGRYFGIMEVKVILCLFIKQFTFARVPRPDGTPNTDPIAPDYNTPIVHLKGGLPLMVTRRVPKTVG